MSFSLKHRHRGKSKKVNMMFNQNCMLSKSRTLLDVEACSICLLLTRHYTQTYPAKMSHLALGHNGMVHLRDEKFKI